MILKQIFNQFLTDFWLQFEIALPLDPSQEHVPMGPDFVINSHVSAMRFLKDVSSKSTTFASKKTPKLMLKICKKLFFTLHRDLSTLIRLSFYPRYLQDRQEASKRTPKLMLKICKKTVFTLHRDFSTLIRLSFYPRYLQDRQEASKRSPRCLQAASKMALAVLCKTPK